VGGESFSALYTEKLDKDVTLYTVMPAPGSSTSAVIVLVLDSTLSSSGLKLMSLMTQSGEGKDMLTMTSTGSSALIIKGVCPHAINVWLKHMMMRIWHFLCL
jgi:hypothetical protein